MCTVIVPPTATMTAAESQVENASLEDEIKGAKRKISLSNCGVCGSAESKYTCPACLKHSCSLLCVKKHKEDSGCSGVRNKTAFTALSEFDEMSLLSDYRFLEDTGRLADSTTRDKLVRTPHTTFKAKMLAGNARKMNITLRFLPITFTKSKENSTFCITKENRFLWHLKLIFPQSSTEFSQRRVPDRETLEQILTTYIHPTESDPVRRQKLKMYVHAPFDHVKVFMKAEGRKANSVRYHELDLGKTLRDNLSYKTLIEYPVLHVVLKGHYQDYPLKGPAEPASACSSFATKRQGEDQGKKEVSQIATSPLGSCAPGGTSIWTGTQETSPEIEPPKEKRAKRETGEEELEEGEIFDSDDDGEEEVGNTDENNLVSKSSTGGDGDIRDPNFLSDMKETQDELAGSVGNEDENLTTTAVDNGTVRAGPEVSMTKEDALEEPGPVHTHHHDTNESTNATEYCG